MVLPNVTDYAIVKKLKTGLKEVKGKLTGTRFLLPPRFMEKAISAIKSQPTHRILDI